MNIGMMGGWNTDSGASFHTEMIGRRWVELGHWLRVFTFYEHAFHGTQITGKDEEYVNRCFTVEGFSPPELNPLPLLTEPYEVFVVQDLGMLPKDLLGKVFHRIKEKAKTVNVIHDGRLSTVPSFYQFDWDAVVCFDERYAEFLRRAHDPRKLHIIPYPCFPGTRGDKLSKRQLLSLPEERKTILTFGPSSKLVVELLPSIEELSGEYPILLLAVTKDSTAIGEFGKYEPSAGLQIKVRNEAPDVHRLYDYLHASDLLVFNKTSTPQVVVSSTAFQCLSSGCPIVARNSNYVEFFNNEVMTFDTPDQLKERLRSVFDETDEYQATREAAGDWVLRNSANVVGEMYIELFEQLAKGV